MAESGVFLFGTGVGPSRKGTAPHRYELHVGVRLGQPMPACGYTPPPLQQMENHKPLQQVLLLAKRCLTTGRTA